MAKKATETVATTLEDLVQIFEEEAEKLCDSDTEARVLAAEALSDFVNSYAKEHIVG